MSWFVREGATVFEQALLESGPSRQPVLSPGHWWVSCGVGACAFLGAQAALRGTFVFQEASRLSAQSAGVGVLAFAHALMLCFVLADSRRLRLNAWVWAVALMTSNFLGFFAYLVYSASKSGDWKRVTLPAAYALEALLVGGLILVPLVYPEALPRVVGAISLTPSFPSARGSQATRSQSRRFRRSEVKVATAPTFVPNHIPDVIEAPPPPEHRPVGDLSIGSPDGFPICDFLGLGATSPPPPAPPMPRGGIKEHRIKVGGIVEAAKLLFAPRPEYPILPRLARIQDTVRLEAVISKEGTVQELKVLRGHPALAKAAIEAVSRWRYQPTLLNGEPVEVVTEIDVKFILSD